MNLVDSVAGRFGTDLVSSIRSRSVSRVLRVAAVVLASVGTACGGSSVGPAQPADEATQALPIEVKAPVGLGEKVAAKVTSGLSNRGFHIVADGDPSELLIKIDVHVREETGIIKVYVAGKLKKDRVARCALSVVAQGVVIESVEVEFDADEPPPADEMAKLIASVADSGSVKAHAAKYRRRQRRAANDADDQRKAKAEQEKRATRAEAARQEAKKKAAAEAAAQKEASAWAPVVLSVCAEPVTTSGCEQVQEYLSEFPTGAHAAEAKAALEVGMKKIAALKDEQAWSNAGVSKCKKPKLSSDCSGVKKYMAEYPNGAHAEEATTLFEKSRKKIARLEKKEIEAARRAEEAEARAAEREMKKIQREEMKRKKAKCRQNCKERCYGNRRPGTCVSRCSATFCNNEALRD